MLPTIKDATDRLRFLNAHRRCQTDVLRLAKTTKAGRKISILTSGQYHIVEGKPPQIKFIIFEEAILDVFGQCVQCGSKCVITAENQVGSCFKICIACSTNSEHYFEWTTGPCVSKMTAFHLLLGSAILATGMESSKVRLFQALKLPKLKQRELSSILGYYTIPAVYNVWNAEQSARLQEAKEEPIVIASDMRVDSPGHSGLFGSGSTLNMTKNVILDTQVIKVNFIALKYDISKCVTQS